MPKPTQSGSSCTGRCHMLPNAHQTSPLVVDRLMGRSRKEATKKGAPFSGSKAEGPGKAQLPGHGERTHPFDQ